MYPQKQNEKLNKPYWLGVIVMGIIVGVILAVVVKNKYPVENIPKNSQHCTTIDYSDEVSDYINYYSDNCFGEVHYLSTQCWGERDIVRIEIDGVDTVTRANENIMLIKEYSENNQENLDCLFQIVMSHVISSQDSDWISILYTMEASSGVVTEIEFVGQSLSGYIPFDGVYNEVQIVELFMVEEPTDEDLAFFEIAYPNADIVVTP